MLITECLCHGIHVLFDDISYDVRSAHWYVNNKIKRKFNLFLMNTTEIFVSCNENIKIFILALHL